MEKKQFTHFNSEGRGKMVDVSEKPVTARMAKAQGYIYMQKTTLELIKTGGMKKGDVLSVAQIAGILGVKKTAEIIPMCHNIFISSADLEFEIQDDRIKIEAVVKTSGQTGIEMEALAGVTTAALTIYDMCKAVDKSMVISGITLLEKTGGKSHYIKGESL